jgi:repressor LexA
MADTDQVYKKDVQRLAQLRDYFADNRKIPSYRFMCELLDLKSMSVISKFVARLKHHGFLDAAPDNKLVPGKRFFERPLSNATVQAGAFTASLAEGTDYMSIDEHLVRKPSVTELIPVAGDSMKDAGILDGDTVIVEKRASANIGDIVVAIVDDRFTIKTLGKEKERFILIPANKAFETIRPGKDASIYGVVVGSFRRY